MQQEVPSMKKKGKSENIAVLKEQYEFVDEQLVWTEEQFRYYLQTAS